MDLVSTCKDKLAYFRIKELKDVLSQLGLAKQGKKQDLLDRILALLSDEQVSKSHGWGKKNSIGKDGVAKIIDDTYRKMQVPGAMDLASKSHSGSEFNLVKPKEEADNSYQLDMKVRCPCGSSLITESMIKCEDPRCRVWQHIGCVIIPENPMEGVPPELPSQFFCDICRINRADPFWVTITHPLLPLRLTSSGTAADGTPTIQNMDRTFPLSKADREMLQRTEYDLQVWCILLNDKVPFRMQWPQHTELQVNCVPVRTTNRQGSQLLGINGRDDGPVITTSSREGVNKICLSRCDARIFCFGIRIAKRRTFQQVISLVPKEADGEHFDDALSRVRRCIGGGTATENAESDSDLEVVADSITVNLRCPMSGSRMRVAGRFKPCIHMGCFDLEAFVELNQRSRKWQCPVCLKNYSLEHIIIDPYFNRITSLMRNCGEDVTEIDVKPDGCWRAKNEVECRELAQWHSPGGSLCPVNDADVKPDLGTLRLGIKRNHNGIWEVSKPEDVQPRSSGNHVVQKFEHQNVLPMSSSATGSFKDGEDPSVNQDGGHFDFSVNNGAEFDSVPLSFDPTYNVEDQIPPALLKDADLIVLSDSDDENATMISRETIYDTGGTEVPFVANYPVVSERFSEDLGLGTSGTAGLPLFNSNVDDYGMPLWPMQTGTQTGPGFQLFGTDADNADALVAPIGGYGLASDGGIGDGLQAQDHSTFRSSDEIDESLVDNPLAFSGDDPSLQIFLPSRSAGATLQADSGGHNEMMPNGDHSDDWISLTLAAGGGHSDPPPPNGLNLKQQFTQKENRMNSLADTASLLLSMNDDRSKKSTSNSQRPDSGFSLPCPPRSVRPRLYLSIDTDSE